MSNFETGSLHYHFTLSGSTFLLPIPSALRPLESPLLSHPTFLKSVLSLGSDNICSERFPALDHNIPDR